MFTIRPFTYSDQDYAAVIAIHNAVWPDQSDTIEAWKYRDRVRNQQYFYQPLLVEAAEQPVAMGHSMETPWSYRPGKYALGITVHPDYQRRGIATMVYAYMMTKLGERDLPPTLLISNTREDKAQSIRFLQQRGFQQVMRAPMSRLDVTAFDGSRFAAVVAKVKAAGIAIHSVAELVTFDPDHRHKLYELDWQCTLDEPLPDAPTKPTFEEYTNHVFEHPRFIPEAYFVAIDNREYVGLSELSRNLSKPTELNTGFTAVLGSHRRRGIATALKACAIAYAQHHGYQAIKTGNEENNPMFTINLTLGFTPEPAWLDFQKIIVPTEA